MATTRSVFGIYPNRQRVESALEAFQQAGFANTDISMLLPDSPASEELVTGHATKAPEGAAAGAGSGAVVGGALGWLAGVGALVMPGVGPFLAAGPLIATLIGMGVGTALGGLTGALIGVGIPESEAKRYQGQMLQGGALVAIQCHSAEDMLKARNVMKATGATDTSESTSGPTDLKASA